MKIITAIILFILANMYLYSQTLQPEVLSSAGGSFNLAGYTFDWTIGEMLAETHSAQSNFLTEGIHQTRLGIDAVDEDGLLITLSVFPNPTSGLANIRLNELIIGDAVFEVFNQMGQKLISKKMFINNETVLIDLSEYSPGLYHIRMVKGDATVVQNLSIIKF